MFSWLANVQWKVVLDQLHNLVLSAGAITAALGFSSGNNLAGSVGAIITALTAIVSGSNVMAAIKQTPPAA